MRTRGIMLIECIVYLAVFFVIAGLAGGAFYRALDYSRHLRRITGQIAQTLDAGERWRTDVRAASAPVRLMEDADGQTLRIPRGSNEVVYRFGAGSMLRSVGDSSTSVRVLSNLGTSKVHREDVAGVISWRWEVELKSDSQGAQRRPLFTFESVARVDQAR